MNTNLKKIKMVLTDVDGVLTDTGVYYNSEGEELKRFSIRDGMGVERLWKLCNVETGIITGENSQIVAQRAKKLNLEEVHLGIKNKAKCFDMICSNRGLRSEEIAYIGDDMNDLEIILKAGVSACPCDAVSEIMNIVDIVLDNKGGYGAFREFAEIIIESKQNK
jgi:3-deoxy-D-manno-octulosonate 8-phosphate phosphatase (KDO 8-P phosphatase)